MADEGESSASFSRDIEDSEDPPIKKARYSWQIQGSGSTKESKPSRSEDLSRNRREASCSSHSHSRLSVGRLVTSSNYPVFKWQTRQIAKAVVDNTINKVIEDMGFVPFAQDLMDDMFPMNQRDEHVEDEAVLMAIQSHGLQQKDWLSSSPPSHSKSSHSHDSGLAQLKSWYEFENDENTVVANSWRTNESALNQGPSINNNSIVEPCLPQPNPPYENKSMPNLDKTTAEKNADNLLDKNVFEHDFLAQAVAVAIQKKGLSTYLADESR